MLGFTVFGGKEAAPPPEHGRLEVQTVCYLMSLQMLPSVPSELLPKEQQVGKVLVLSERQSSPPATVHCWSGGGLNILVDGCSRGYCACQFVLSRVGVMILMLGIYMSKGGSCCLSESRKD